MKPLTPVQLEVLRARARGIPLKEIAFNRRRSLKTIEYHWANIQARLGLQDVVAICRWAWTKGIA